MKVRWAGWVLGSASALLVVAVGVATNQILNEGRWSLAWLGGATVASCLSVMVAQRLARAGSGNADGAIASTVTQVEQAQELRIKKGLAAR